MNHIVNCCGREINNKWGSFGISYFTLNWRDTDDQIIFSAKYQGIIKAALFIDSALQKGGSVLVSSSRGQSRSACVILCYLILQYHWNLDKSLSFIRLRKTNIHIRQPFMKQLRELDGDAHCHLWMA